MNEKYLSKSAFAASQGWSASYITKLKDQERLVMHPDNSKLIDVAATLASLERTGKNSTPSGVGTGYWKSRSDREKALASLAQLELEKQRGNLVDRKGVETAAFSVGRMLRDTLMGLPTQIAPELINMTDSYEIELKLRDALRKVLTDHAKLTADDVARAFSSSGSR